MCGGAVFIAMDRCAVGRLASRGVGKVFFEQVKGSSLDLCIVDELQVVRIEGRLNIERASVAIAVSGLDSVERLSRLTKGS